MFVLWVKMKRDTFGFGLLASEFEHGEAGLPYAADVQPARKIAVKRGRLE
jgi:hypothetical protein